VTAASGFAGTVFSHCAWSGGLPPHAQWENTESVVYLAVTRGKGKGFEREASG